MSSLRDLIPDDSQRELVASQIEPGAVFFVPDPRAEKSKFIIVLGVDSEKVIVGTLYINTEINEHCIRSFEEKKLQHKIKASDHPFLDYDSYVNASLITKRRQGDLLQILIDNSCECKGYILEKEFDYIRSLMAVSRIISEADKKRFSLI